MDRIFDKCFAILIIAFGAAVVAAVWCVVLYCMSVPISDSKLPPLQPDTKCEACYVFMEGRDGRQRYRCYPEKCSFRRGCIGDMEKIDELIELLKEKRD